MATIATALIVLVAAIHVFIVVLEMFLWRTPYGCPSCFSPACDPIAALASEPVAFQVRIFFLACVVVAGVYGAATVNRRILAVQALPAALALAAVLVAGPGTAA